MSTTEKHIPSAICPACDAIDPRTRYIAPESSCDPETGYNCEAAYECQECGATCDVEEWEHLANNICVECGEVGRACTCPGEDFIERARRRAPIAETVTRRVA